MSKAKPVGFPTFTWPEWREAPCGTRFVHLQTGSKGTYVKPSKNKHNGAIVVWDYRPFPVRSVDGIDGHVYFVGIAQDARPLRDRSGNYLVAGEATVRQEVEHEVS